MMFRPTSIATCAALLFSTLPAQAQSSEQTANTQYDPELARSVQADEYGMRSYVLVILKSGPNKVPPGPERDEMFKGHFANMNRLLADGKLALAGPFDDANGWRGLFIFAVSDVDEAKMIAAGDPVIIKGEMVAEYHKYYGSAALMLVKEAHQKIAKKRL